MRPKFSRFSPKKIQDILGNYHDLKSDENINFKFSEAGNHIWLGIGALKREFWSPTLHLELDATKDGQTFVKGTFGPNPLLWVTFVGLHFILGILFILFGVIAYSKHSVGASIKFDMVVMFAIANGLLLLNAIAILNRKKGAQQMRELLNVAQKIID
ncbi:hypothetical protein GV828_04060 [Flavobacterium sp. NST-5]|uniref:GTP-binding protein n=1 Tax=Flavobacterium ichthyis TaxID=2698827 RepID=A0ABW9Z6B3_9FLAO|nr:hypothetical protein [Flavobacterium ichthyis]NBL64375.1 hypothetical protein [Flavobacterium ichthyis]